MLDVKVRHRWHIYWALGAIAFALIVTWQNRGLTFFWDEWDVVWATLESPYYGMLQDNGGNFFPLSRLVFGAELALFGGWYPGYVLVTSLIFGSAVFAFNVLLDNGTTARRISLSALAVIYLSSTGVLFASSMGFMLKWGLSPLLAIISAGYFMRSRNRPANKNRNLVIAWLFFFMSWAAFSSSIAIMALLIIGLIHSNPIRQGEKLQQKIEFRLSILILFMAAVAVVVGIVLAKLNPPLNPLVGNAQETLDFVSQTNLVNVSLLALASTLAGIFSVITALPLHDNAINSWLIIAFRDYLVVPVVLLVAVFAFIYALRKSLPTRQLTLVFLLLFVTNLFISITRSPLIHRYQALWIFIAIIFLILLIDWLAFLRFATARFLLISVISVAGIYSFWHISTDALSIANIERNRSLVDSAKLADASNCITEAETFASEFSPTIEPSQVCAILGVLDHRSWILERQQIPR